MQHVDIHGYVTEQTLELEIFKRLIGALLTYE